jgi:hypothetical protein
MTAYKESTVNRTTYNVHIYREMRLVFAGIESETPETAAAIARGMQTQDAVEIDDCEGMTLSALVDVDGDEEYEHSVVIDFEEERHRKAAPVLLAACRMVVARWEHGDLAEAARSCSNAIVTAEAAGIGSDLAPAKRPSRCGIDNDPAGNAGPLQKQLTSSAMFHTPGLFRALQNDYRISGKPRRHAVKTLSDGYGLSREEAAGLLSGAIRSEIDDAAGTVTFTSRCEASPAASGPVQSPYSVLLLYPDYANDGGTETYYAFVTAADPIAAVAEAQRQAAAAQDGIDIEPEDFAPLLVTQGHQYGEPLFNK